MSRRDTTERNPSLTWIIPAMKEFAERNYSHHQATIRQFAVRNAPSPRYCARLPNEPKVLP